MAGIITMISYRLRLIPVHTSIVYTKMIHCGARLILLPSIYELNLAAPCWKNSPTDTVTLDCFCGFIGKALLKNRSIVLFLKYLDFRLGKKGLNIKIFEIFVRISQYWKKWHSFRCGHTHFLEGVFFVTPRRLFIPIFKQRLYHIL